MRPRYDIFLSPPAYDDGMDHDHIDKLAQCIVKAWQNTPDMTLQELSDAVRPLGLPTMTRVIWHVAPHISNVS